MLASDYARYKVEFYTPGCTCSRHYRQTLEACCDLITREFILNAGSVLDIRDATVYGTNTPKFERNPQWDRLMFRENPLFGKLQCQSAV